MKISLLSTFDQKGGAAIACQRLKQSLEPLGVNCGMISQNEAQNIGYWEEKMTRWRLAAEVFYTAGHLKDRKYRFAFSPARFGLSIASNPVIKEADIIHLHWINQGFLSLNSLQELVQLQKPIVWTLHDMWAFTGGCHHSRECGNYSQNCGNCWYLTPKENDLSRIIWEKKKALYSQLNLHIVTCSNWLGKCAKSSSLFAQTPISVIPNAIDTHKYLPCSDKKLAKKKLGYDTDKFIITMSAFNISDERKGVQYLKKAVEYTIKACPNLAQKIHIVLIGKVKDASIIHLPVPFTCTGYITDEQQLVEIYQASDVFVLPSLEENLPNTIMEALACGIPALAFNVGGISDLIEHQKNGYLAQYLSSEDLAQGLLWLYRQMEESQSLQTNAREKTLNHFSSPIVGRQYQKVYESLMG